MRYYSRRGRVAVGVVLAALLIVLGLFGYELAFRYQWATDTLDDIAPRYARLAGLKLAGDEVRATAGKVEAALSLIAYPEAMDHGKVGSDLQQHIRKLAEANGMTVLNSQVLVAKAQKGFSELPLSLVLEGEVAGIRGLLAGLRMQKPSIQVDELTLQPARGRPRQGVGPQRVTMNIVVSAITLAGGAK